MLFLIRPPHVGSLHAVLVGADVIGPADERSGGADYTGSGADYAGRVMHDISQRRLRTDAHLLRLRTRGKFRRLFDDIGANASLELFWKSLCGDVLNRNGAEVPPVVATGAAANWSLIYLTCRSVLEWPASRVCEIGSGETTVVLNALGKFREFEHVVVETDPHWAALMSERLDLTLRTTATVEREVRGLITAAYQQPPLGPFDLVIVDGPGGTKRQSRWSSLEILNDLTDDYVVIFDDVDRRGEQDLVRRFLRERPQARCRFFVGSKAQCVVFDGHGSAAQYW